MYIEYEVFKTMDFADLITDELFLHATRDESKEVILEITRRFFEYYDGDKAKSN